jgi:hypothetical protein
VDEVSKAVRGLGTRLFALRAAEASIRVGLGAIDYRRSLGVHAGDAGAQAEDDKRFSSELVSAGNAVYGAGTIGQLLRRTFDSKYAGDEAYIDQTEREEKRRVVRLDQQQRRTQELERRNADLARRGRVGQAAGLSRTGQEAFATAEQTRELNEYIAKLGPGEMRNLDVREAIESARRGIQGQEAQNFRGDEFRASQGFYGLRALQSRNAGDERGARRLEFSAGLQREREAARGESPEALSQFDREGKAARTKEFEDRERRDREKAETDSALRIADSIGRVETIALRRRGEGYAADVADYARSWDEKLTKARLAVSQETDLEEKGRRQRELSAMQRERDAEVAAFAERRKRQEVDETAQHEARVREYALRAAGQSYRADEDAFEAAWEHKIATAQDNEARIRAIEERDAARSARRADQARRTRDVLFGASQTTLRAEGRGGVADILQIKREADEAFKEAAGNPQLQQAVRLKEAADLRALDRRLADRGTFESIGGPKRVDFRNRLTGATDPQKDTADVLRDVIAKLLGQIEKNTKTPQPGVTS